MSNSAVTSDPLASGASSSKAAMSQANATVVFPAPTPSRIITGDAAMKFTVAAGYLLSVFTTLVLLT